MRRSDSKVGLESVGDVTAGQGPYVRLEKDGGAEPDKEGGVVGNEQAPSRVTSPGGENLIMG